MLSRSKCYQIEVNSSAIFLLNGASWMLVAEVVFYFPISSSVQSRYSWFQGNKTVFTNQMSEKIMGMDKQSLRLKIRNELISIATRAGMRIKNPFIKRKALSGIRKDMNSTIQAEVKEYERQLNEGTLTQEEFNEKVEYLKSVL